MTDGVAILRAVLVAAGPVTAEVAATNIVAGVVPLGTGLPALSLTSVATTYRKVLSKGSKRRVTERVQATAMAATYPAVKVILKAAKNAADGTTPTVSGATEITVEIDSDGPDFMNEEASIYLGTQDFRVGFNEAT